MNVDEALKMKLPAGGADVIASIRGILVCTSQFTYLASALDSPSGILVIDSPPVFEKLLQCADARGGSMITFHGPSLIIGSIGSNSLPMFPAVLHSIHKLTYCDQLVLQRDDTFILQEPDDITSWKRIQRLPRDSTKNCTQPECSEIAVAESEYCPAHHHEELYGLDPRV